MAQREEGRKERLGLVKGRPVRASLPLSLLGHQHWCDCPPHPPTDPSRLPLPCLSGKWPQPLLVLRPQVPVGFSPWGKTKMLVWKSHNRNQMRFWWKCFSLHQSPEALAVLRILRGLRRSCKAPSRRDLARLRKQCCLLWHPLLSGSASPGGTGTERGGLFCPLCLTQAKDCTGWGLWWGGL